MQMIENMPISEEEKEILRKITTGRCGALKEGREWQIIMERKSARNSGKHQKFGKYMADTEDKGKHTEKVRVAGNIRNARGGGGR